MLFCCLRHNVEASCHTLRRRLPPSTNTAVYQRRVSSTCHGPSQLSVLHLAFTARDGARLAQNRDFYIPHLHSMPPFGGSRRNITMTFGIEKLEWCGYTAVKKLKICLFISAVSTNTIDRRTDTHTDTAWRHRPRLHSIARQKRLQQ